MLGINNITEEGVSMASGKAAEGTIEVLNITRCDRGKVCLTCNSDCQTEAYLDRDVQVLRCLSHSSCTYKKKYKDWVRCTCPENKMAL